VSAEQIEFLTEYDQWKVERRAASSDLSPEAFLIDRAKEQALEKLIKIADLMDTFYKSNWDDDDGYEIACTKLHDGIQEVLE
jgi:hypothetical protein